MPLSLATIGSGNVATHLVRAFSAAPEIELKAILSRTPAHAESLAREASAGCYAGSDFEKLSELRPDIILISVADNALPDVVEAVGKLAYDPLVVHTSGTLPKEDLSGISSRTGVFYPFQTFSKDVQVDVSVVPVFTETSLPEDLLCLDTLAHAITDTVRNADAEKRRKLHIAGVLSCNFVNYLLEMTQGHLAASGFGLEVVEALVRTTVDKAFSIGPHAAQTGPAVRGDLDVIRSQRLSLDGNLREVYSLFSRLIMEAHNIKYEQNQL